MNFKQFYRNPQTILQRILPNFYENFIKHVKKFHSLKKNFSLFSRDFNSIFGKISHNLKVNFIQLLWEIYAIF